MNTDWIFISVAIAGTVAGTVTDLKNRWVPDWVNYFMIIFGLGGHALLSITQWSIWPFAYSAAAAGILYGVACVLFYSGAWGGGDAKLFVGLGALLPVFSPLVSAPWPWLMTLWINTLLFGTVLGVLGSFYLAYKHRAKFVPDLKNQVMKNKLMLYLLPAFFALPVAFYVLNMPTELFFLSFVSVLFPFLYIILKAVEHSCMFKHIPPHRLVEGDWVAEDVNIGSFTYKPARSGIEKKDIEKLVEFEKHGKLKLVKIKEGLPYVPAILLGFLASVFYGDFLFKIVMGFLA